LKQYFDALIQSHSWNTVKLDRNGLQFFYRYTLDKQWQWLNIVKPPQVKRLPDILTPQEIGSVISATKKQRYQVFFLTLYSMGLRLSEGLNLTIFDIDRQMMMKMHIRNGKGGKDRYVPLPSRTLLALRRHWLTHHHPQLISPGLGNGKDTPMDKGGVQKALKQVIRDCHINKNISLNTTARYAHLTPTKQHCNTAAINQLADALSLQWRLS